ncbi:hypothetical protein [Paenibacillus pinihumi]|uniref:hypothetical protein n=1 Tax=Paenibacillus pinihumi TaxID=669462 RepID=UPI00041A89FB|nr:hypothetical protein [Paenibacillus pinihumi]
MNIVIIVNVLKNSNIEGILIELRSIEIDRITFEINAISDTPAIVKKLLILLSFCEAVPVCGWEIEMHFPYG